MSMALNRRICVPNIVLSCVLWLHIKATCCGVLLMWRLGVGLCFAAVLLALAAYEGGRWTVSCDRLLSAVCCLAGLYCAMAGCRVEEGSEHDSIERMLVRKQLHAMNWRFVSNKAIALILVQRVLRDRQRTDKRRMKRSGSDEGCVESSRVEEVEEAVGGPHLRQHLRAHSI